MRTGLFALAISVLISCEDDTGAVGFKNPNGDFDVFVKEFTLPTKTYLRDSVDLSYGFIDNSAVVKSTAPNRLMVGHAEDPIYGKTTATAYSAFYSSTFAFYDPAAVFTGAKMTLVFDYYWYGAETDTEKQPFEIYELADSMLTYLPHYSNQSQRLGRLIGTTTYPISPTNFNEDLLENANAATTGAELNMDSLQITLDNDWGKSLFTLAMDTVHRSDMDLFYKFRKIFKGVAIKAPGADKIVGFDVENPKSRIVVDYRIDTTKYELVYYFSAPGVAVGTPEYMSYTQVETDRSGTPLAGLSTPYQDYDAPTGLNYIQAGTGVVTKLDFSEVIEHFKTIPIKALSVAELRIESDEQDHAPTSFLLRAIKSDNHDINTSIRAIDVAQDPYQTINTDFLTSHLLSSRTDGGYGSPYYKAEALGDDGSVFLLNQASNTDGKSLYSGYMTNYMQNEVGLDESLFLRNYVLIPYAPDISRGFNGFYFPPGSAKLKIYYTTPRTKQQ